MKNTKKLASLLLVLVMALALTVPAFATQEGTLTGGSITINDAVPGQTYKAYQILYLESYNETAKAYAYKANTAWSSFINSDAIKGTYVKVDAQGYVTWVEGADAAAFAKLAQVEAAKMTADASATAPAAAEGATYSTVKFENLKLGYYLVDTTLGTLCSLDTTNPNVTMQEKNEVPTNVKTVEEDSTGNYGEKNDADIGQTVNFKSTVTLPKGSENVVFHDKMSAGLTPDMTSIKVYTNEEMTTELAASNYTVTTTGLNDSCTFEVSFAQDYLDSLTADSTTVYVKYSAILNENAVIAGEGNPNTSKLSYGEINSETHEPSGTTPPSTTTTYTWDVDVFKYTMNGATETALAGATFTLSKNADGSNPIAVVSEGNNVYRVAKTGEDDTVTKITTDATGKFTIKGLDADTYYLTETAAPAGYNVLLGAVKVVIDSNGDATYYNYDATSKSYPTNGSTGEVKVLNQTGALLPSTGGIGTTIFYVLGSILVLGAGVLLIAKKRMGEEK